MARGGVRRDYDSSRRAKRIAIVAGIVLFILLWIGAVVWLGRMGSADSQQASSEISPQTTTQEQTALEEDAGGAQQGSSTQDSGQGSDPQEPQQSSGESSLQEGSVPQETFDSLDEEGGQQQQEGSTASEQPEPQPSEQEIDTTRARTASERYIVAAYGYTGSDEEEYLEGIEQAASEEIYDSPGGEKLEGYAKAASECGMKSTAIIEDFQVVGQSPEGLDATITFSVEDADGQTHTFTQEQRLNSTNGVYEVSGVSVEKLISETTPTESCPGSDADRGGQGQQNQDPGTSQTQAENSVTNEQQASSAAGRFVAAAYGYSGNSTQEYRAGVEKTAITEELLNSPGGERIKEYSETAGDEGIEAAAKLERFEVTQQSGEEIEGTAYFDVGSSYGQGGELEVATTPYKQELILKPYEGSYRVSSASPEQEVQGQSSGSEEERKLTK